MKKLIVFLMLVTLAFAAAAQYENTASKGVTTEINTPAVTQESVDVDQPATTAATVWQLFAAHWAELLFAVLALVKIVVRITPTLKDDAVFAKLDALIEWIVPNLKKTKR